MCLLLVATSGRSWAVHTWAERLGYPAQQKVLILYAAHMGLCFETNQAGRELLESGAVQAAGVMAPCPWFKDFARWARNHPNLDIGLSLTMNSPGIDYRWRPISPRNLVPGLVDSGGFMWRTPLQLSVNGHSAEFRQEIEAQLHTAQAAGMQVTHLDPYLGALLARPELAAIYLETARKHWIPAVVVELTQAHLQQFRDRGTPLNEHMVEMVSSYPLPKLDELTFIPSGKSYEEKREKFFELVRGLSPGITQIIARPAVDSDGLRRISENWQQRVWDAQLLADPAVRDFFAEENVGFTNWKEMMARFDGSVPLAVEGIEVPAP